MATGELILTGYRVGDFTLNGEISKSFSWKKGSALWRLTGGIINKQPSFGLETGEVTILNGIIILIRNSASIWDPRSPILPERLK
jgi:hypothetical protein